MNTIQNYGQTKIIIEYIDDIDMVIFVSDVEIAVKKFIILMKQYILILVVAV
jgi:hypothetical protein